MIELKKLNIIKIANNQPLLKNFNIVLNRKDKCAIIGEEGNGKSILIKVIYNLEEVMSYATVNDNIKVPSLIGYLSQDFDNQWNDTSAREFLSKKDFSSEPNYDLYNDYDKLLIYFNDLNISMDFLDSEQKMATLSGGEKVKLSLIKILIYNPEVILLDEPTNNLDIETLEFLEEFINKIDVPILYVSHDETLLENTANMIIHLERLNKVV